MYLNDETLLLHFTHIDNLESIIKSGILCNPDEKNLKTDFGKREISLSIEYPNYMYLHTLIKSNGEKYVIICIKYKNIKNYNMQFYKSNPYFNRWGKASKVDDLFDKSFRYPKLPQKFTSDPRAEIRVSQDIPPTYFEFILYPSSLKKEIKQFENSLYTFVMCNSIFKKRMDYKFWDQIRKHNIDVVASYNPNISTYENHNVIKKYSDFCKYKLWDSEKYAFEKYCNKTQNNKILIIGCGCGRTIMGLNDIGFNNIVGVDFSKGMIKQAKKNCSIYNSELYVADALTLPFKNKSFDTVFMPYNVFSMIPSVNARLRALIEAKRVLKDNGIIIFTVSTREKKQYRLFWFKRFFLEKQFKNIKNFNFGDLYVNDCHQKSYIHFSTKKEIKYLLSLTNFKILDIFRRDKVGERDDIKKVFGDDLFYIVKKH